MNSVTVIIPIYNIRSRGLKRVMNGVYSLQNQNCDIIVVNGSEVGQFWDLDRLFKGLRVNHIHLPLDEFNKPKLLNAGINLATTEYIFCSDGDYIFKHDLIEVCEKFRGEKVLLHKKVKMLPSVNITTSRIANWKFPSCKFNVWGTLANGAMQYATRKFFTDNPYNELMSGFGAMDNLTAYVAYNNGLSIVWIDDSEIMHQHHVTEKKMSGANKAKFERNQKILQDYVDDNNLPKLLRR